MMELRIRKSALRMAKILYYGGFVLMGIALPVTAVGGIPRGAGRADHEGVAGEEILCRVCLRMCDGVGGADKAERPLQLPELRRSPYGFQAVPAGPAAEL